MRCELDKAYATELENRTGLADVQEQLRLAEAATDAANLRQRRVLDVAEGEMTALRQQLEQSQQLEQGCAEKLSSALIRTRLHSQRASKLARELATKTSDLQAALQRTLPGSDGAVTLQKHQDTTLRLTNLRKAVSLTPEAHRALLKELPQATDPNSGALLRYLDPDSRIKDQSVQAVKKAYQDADASGGPALVGQCRLDRYLEHVLDAMAGVCVNPHHQLQLLDALNGHFTDKTFADALTDRVLQTPAVRDVLAQIERAIERGTTIEKQLALMCGMIRPKGRVGALSLRQRNLLHPIAILLNKNGIGWKRVGTITGLGKTARRKLKKSTLADDGTVQGPPLYKEREGGRVYPQSVIDETRDYWIEESREAEGKSDTVSSGDPRKSKHNPTGSSRARTRWIRGTFAAHYKDYVEKFSANHAAEIEDGAARVPSYSFFMQHKPVSIRKEGKMACLCSRCLEFDLHCESMADAVRAHRRRSPGCGCTMRPNLIVTGRCTERTMLCTRGPEPHAQGAVGGFTSLHLTAAVSSLKIDGCIFGSRRSPPMAAVGESGLTRRRRMAKTSATWFLAWSRPPLIVPTRPAGTGRFSPSTRLSRSRRTWKSGSPVIRASSPTSTAPSLATRCFSIFTITSCQRMR